MTHIILKYNELDYIQKPTRKRIDSTMKALVQLENLNCPEDKRILSRNLCRIMDVRIIDIDVDRGLLLFLCAGPITLQKVRQELSRLGYRIQSCNFPLSDLPVLNGNGASKTRTV